MDSIISAVKSVCIISAAICIIDLLASGTKFRNQIKFLLNLVFILVIITPITGEISEFSIPDVENYFNTDYSKSEEVYYKELERQTSENISSVLKAQIEAAGIICYKLETSINISKTNSISISSVTISTDNFEEAAAIIRNSLGSETEVLNGNYQ